MILKYILTAFLDYYRKKYLFKCREEKEGFSDPMVHTSTIIVLQIMFSVHHWRGKGNISRVRELINFCNIVSSRNDSDATPMISQQYGCLNNTWTMTIQRHMLVWKAPILYRSLSGQCTIGNSWLLKENYPCSKMSLLISNNNCSFLKSYTNN